MKLIKLFSHGLIIFVLLFSISLFAQENKTLSLDECIQIALENNSQLKNSHTDVEIAREDVWSAGSALLPRISTYFSSGRQIQGEQRRVGDVPVGVDSVTGQIIYAQREYIQAKSERNSHSAQISINQTLWDWGRSYFTLKQANLGKSYAQQNLISIKNSVIYNVKQTYYSLLKAIELGKVYEEAVKLSEEQLKRTEVMHQIGSVALADVYKARVKLGTDKSNLITQQNMIIKAKADLNNSLGLDPESAINVVEFDPGNISEKYSMDDALEASLSNNPLLKQYELNIDNYGLEKRKAVTAFLPSIYGQASYSRYNEYFDLVYNKKLDRDYVINIGAQLNLNIFNGFADKAELQRQSLNHQKAEENLIEQKRLLKAQVTNAFLSLKAYREISEINETNLQSAEEDLRLAQESYKIGAGTLLEVIDSQLAVTQARSTLISSKYDSQIALAYLESLMSNIGK